MSTPRAASGVTPKGAALAARHSRFRGALRIGIARRVVACDASGPAEPVPRKLNGSATAGRGELVCVGGSRTPVGTRNWRHD